MQLIQVFIGVVLLLIAIFTFTKDKGVNILAFVLGGLIGSLMLSLRVAQTNGLGFNLAVFFFCIIAMLRVFNSKLMDTDFL